MAPVGARSVHSVHVLGRAGVYRWSTSSLAGGFLFVDYQRKEAQREAEEAKFKRLDYRSLDRKTFVWYYE